MIGPFFPSLGVKRWLVAHLTCFTVLTKKLSHSVVVSGKFKNAGEVPGE